MTILQPIAPEGCGCDRRDTLKTLLSVDDALALIACRDARLSPDPRCSRPILHWAASLPTLLLPFR